MKKEIRQEIRDYILSDVNMVLARLGVSENAKETGERSVNCDSVLHYEFETPAIRQQPMMFKKAYVDGYMVSIEIKDENDRFYQLAEENDIVVVVLDWRWQNFGGGSNGADLGRIIYAVKKELPEKFGYFGGDDTREYYVHKLEGIKL